MVATARPRPMTAQAARSMPAGRRPVRSDAHPTLASGAITSRHITLLVVQGTLVGCLILAVLAAIWFFFGDALRNQLNPIAVPSAAQKSAGPGPTLYYRDRGDGSFTVMEIDANGTRMKGTIHRNDVPLLQADKVHEGWGNRTTTTNSRVNALGSSFR